MCEALRFEPPVSSATPFVLLEDNMQLGKYKFAKGDVLRPLFYGLHRNANEW